jgi:hypothetical protein
VVGESEGPGVGVRGNTESEEKAPGQTGPGIHSSVELEFQTGEEHDVIHTSERLYCLLQGEFLWEYSGSNTYQENSNTHMLCDPAPGSAVESGLSCNGSHCFGQPNIPTSCFGDGCPIFYFSSEDHTIPSTISCP